MLDLTTRYLGLKLRTPLVASASPLSHEIDGIRQLEDSGASAVVLYSLFEEQLRRETLELDYYLSEGTESSPESLSYFPQPGEFVLGPDGYLEHIRKAKQAVQIPIIASLNGSSVGSWIQYATQIEQAGADALECNIYWIVTDPEATAQQVEQHYLEILQAVKSAVHIPVAVKLSPFFTNLANVATRLDAAGANALVLFNRFYQPDIDLDELELKPSVLLSTPQAMRLPLTWVGILFGHVKADIAATGGIHGAEDVIKLLMVGANVTMLCSTLLRNGVKHLRAIEQGVRQWMESHEYDSVAQMLGSMSQRHCPDPTAFERAQYMRAVKSIQHVNLMAR